MAACPITPYLYYYAYPPPHDTDYQRITTSRQKWLDFLKGFLIILVVYGHIDIHLLPGDTLNSSISSAIYIFHMPLFFLIMGFLMYSGNYTFGKLKRQTYKRLLQQLYPTVIFFLAFVAIYPKYDVVSGLCHQYKSGYWFTFVAVESFFIVASIVTLLQRLRVDNYKQIIWLLFLALTIKAFCYILQRYTPHLIETGIGSILSMRLLLVHLPYLIVGCTLKIMWENLSRFFHPISFGVLLTASILLLLYPNHFSYHILPFIVCILLFFCAASIPSKFLKTRFGNFICWLGSSTFEIYLLHYFIIELLKRSDSVINFLRPLLNTMFEFPVFLSFSIIVALLCASLAKHVLPIRLRQLIFPKYGHYPWKRVSNSLA